LLTVRVCETGVAAAYVVFPAWLAVTAQDPAPAIASEDPDTEHTPDGVVLKLTGRPELAVAERAIGDTPNVTDAGAVKVMLWDALLTVNVTGTVEVLPFPVTVIVPVNVPAAKPDTLDDTERAAGVVPVAGETVSHAAPLALAV
jgi:hypothetical protein